VLLFQHRYTWKENCHITDTYHHQPRQPQKKKNKAMASIFTNHTLTQQQIQVYVDNNTYYHSIINLLYIHVHHHHHHHIPRSSTQNLKTSIASIYHRDFSREKKNDHGHKNAPIAKSLFSSTLPSKLNPYCFRSNSTFHSSILSYSSLV